MAQSSSPTGPSSSSNPNNASSSSSLPGVASNPAVSGLRRTHVEFARSISAIIDNRTVSIEQRDDDDDERDDEDERSGVNEWREKRRRSGTSYRKAEVYGGKGLRERREARRQKKAEKDKESSGGGEGEDEDDYYFNEKERRRDGKLIRKILENASKNKPKESDWRQQRLQAWEPILTASTVLPSFLLIGLLFIPTGIFLLHSSRSVQEFKLDYTDCERITDSQNQSHCIINFTLEQDFVPDVYLYYVLTNYFQNHRHYAQSRDDEGQLAGRIQDPDAACEPFRFNDDGKPIAPCGIVANSMFNDTFHLDPVFGSHDPDPDGSSSESAIFTFKHEIEYVKINRTNIAWVTDKAYRYRNPSDMSLFDHEWIKPPNWGLAANELDPEDPDDNGFTNEHFLVWMRIGAFPTIRKFYGRVFCDRSYLNQTLREAAAKGDKQWYEEGMPAGNYTMRIAYNYDVSAFSGRKLFILTTTSWFGGKSDFLGVSYIIVGSLILVLTAFLFFIHKAYGQRDREISPSSSSGVTQ